MAPDVVILAGPTAVGKTDVSVALAAHMNAEIVSADSRQIYRRLDIGTAKPNPEIRARIPHHFVDELELDQPWSAGMFQREAEARFAQIHARGKRVLVVGGSTLYIHALLSGLDDIPVVPDLVRAELDSRLEKEGPSTLYRELEAVDPVAARTMDATKSQRIVRALSVYAATGKPLSSFFASRATDDASRPLPLFVLQRDREELYGRINRRVDDMIAAGLITEVRSLLDDGVDPTANPLRTIGYQEVVQHLSGHHDLDETIRLIKRNSRRYAKRQLTWFRRYPDATWIDATAPAAYLLSHFDRVSAGQTR